MEKNNNKTNEINIGAQIDAVYVLRVMRIFASIMEYKKLEIKLRFHYAVILNFTISDILKKYIR